MFLQLQTHIYFISPKLQECIFRILYCYLPVPKSLTVFLLDLFFLALLLDDVLKSQSQDCWLFRQLRLLKFSNIGDIFGLNLVTQPCNLDITLQSLDFIKHFECLSGLFMVDLIIFITQNIFLGYHKIFSSIPCLAVIISLEKHSENCQSTVCVHWTNCPAGRASSPLYTVGWGHSLTDRQTDTIWSVYIHKVIILAGSCIFDQSRLSQTPTTRYIDQDNESDVYK